ncbi:MAG: hypothetical protein BMS9Abin36_1180 [Gammaproteobacteria bacterium]|nr:MAG: hypothetical protein BMS9Abin36_1180 [Gammaproteobacteria bacterium]
MKSFIIFINIYVGLIWGGGMVYAGEMTIESLMSALAITQHAEQTFTERRYSELLTRPLVFRGMLRYKKPDYLEKHVQTPRDQRFIIKGDTLTVERNEQGKRVKHVISLEGFPIMAALTQGLRATMAGDQAQLEKLFTLELSGTYRKWHLLLTPRPEDDPENDETLADVIEAMKLSGDAQHVLRVEIIEKEGDRSVMVINPRP